MGFLDALRGWSGGRTGEFKAVERLVDNSDGHPEFPGRVPAADPDAMALPPATSPYDREQWRRKLKRILGSLPQSEPEWADLRQEAGALDFGEDFLRATYREEFGLMIRKIVSDRVVTSDEHRKLDMARSLMGIPDAEAETMLHDLVAEAESFFGGKVEGA